MPRTGSHPGERPAAHAYHHADSGRIATMAGRLVAGIGGWLAQTLSYAVMYRLRC
jgi:hypothetical protein